MKRLNDIDLIIHSLIHTSDDENKPCSYFFVIPLMHCSTSNAFIDPNCLHGHWYYFNKSSVGDDNEYHEMVFSQDGQFTVFLEAAGWYSGIPYEIKSDSLLVRNDPTSIKYLMLSCDCDQLILATANEGEETDTLVLKPYDMGYWLINQYKFAPKVRAYYTQRDEHHSAFMMRLKEGLIHYEDLDTTGNSEVKIHFEEVEAVLEE